MTAQPSFIRRDEEDRTEAANYVATLAADLAAIARRHRMDTLGYLLDMARLEAENEAQNGRGPGR
jgi:hypothetical protein